MEPTKTSADWANSGNYSHIEILDPDGWDRKNYSFSFNEELITQREFEYRLIRSTCVHNEKEQT